MWFDTLPNDTEVDLQQEFSEVINANAEKVTTSHPGNLSLGSKLKHGRLRQTDVEEMIVALVQSPAYFLHHLV